MRKFLIILVTFVAAGGYLGVSVAAPEHDQLVKLEEDARREWAQVDALLVRRNDLVPSIVAVVQQFSGTEKDILANASAAIAGYRSAGADPSDRIPAAQAADRAVMQIMSLGRAYPDVKQNQNYDRLVSELVKTEDAIAAQRMEYNKAVSALNTEVKSLRGMMVSKLNGTKVYLYYDPPKDALAAPVVSHAQGEAGMQVTKPAAGAAPARALESLKLKGIIANEGGSTTAVLQYPNGRSLNVQTGENVLELNATVKDISEGSVTFEERSVDADGTASKRMVSVSR